MNRSGAALIIAMTVLAALLLLALPFIFSQSSSMAGARAAAWDGAARRGADRAQGLATALGAYATGLHRSPGLVTQLGVAQQAYVQIPVQVQDTVGYPGFADTVWRSVLDSRAEWPTNDGDIPALDTAGALHGAIIEDEGRRLDPNTLGERGWAIVLARAGIRDPFTIAWRWGIKNPGPNPATDPPAPGVHGYWEMVNFGRLARALSWWRPTNSGRFNRLEDLLGADPNQPSSPPPRTLGCIEFGPVFRRNQPPYWPVPEATVEQSRNPAEGDLAVKAMTGETLFDDVNGDNRGYRVAPLTQAELERLRPFLSFLNPGQARSGLIDLGTVVAEAPESFDWYAVTTDDIDPAAMGVGPTLRPHESARIRSQTDPGRRDLNNRWTTVGDALAMECLPWLNINAVPSSSGLVRLFSPTTPADPGWPADPTATPVTSIGGIGRLAWLDGRLGDGVASFERPVLGIQGFGILAIEGAAAALDPQSAATAQRRKRTVVQAVPQERPVEAAWRTQGEFEALLAQRHGSWVIAGPHPTRRIKDWGAVAGDMAALDGAGWLEPAPLVSFTRSVAATFDWRVPFGLTKAQSWDDVLRPVDANGNPDTGVTPAPSPALRASGVTVGALTAQGLRLDGVGLAYDSTSSAGPLRFNGGGYEELRPRHLTMRFCLPTAPGGNVILAEARNQVDPQLYDHRGRPPVPADAAANTAAAGSTNLWRIEYRPTSQMLVLVIANAALPWTAADRERHGVNAWTSGADADPSAAIDPRSGPDPALLFAPTDPATTVEFRYKIAGGLVQGRWYHLQAFCASDRPGLHGLTLDGIVGRDATRPGVDMTRTGDHYTFPSLRLDEDSPDVPRIISVTGSNLAVTDLAVTYPADLDLADLLPARGVVRIDDEFFSYTGLSGSDGTGTLTGVQRARRQNTNQMMTEDLDGNGVLTSSEDLDGDGILDSGEDANGNGRLDSAEDVNRNGILDTVDDYRRWPITQKHNAGALVVPGWSQFEITSGRWLRGDVTIDQPEGLPAAGLATATAEASQLTLDADTDGRPEFTTAVTTLTIVPTGTWSPQGFVLIDVPGVGVARAFYTLAGTTLTLDWTAGTGIRPISGELSSGAVEMQLRQVSLEVDGAVDPIPGIGWRFVAGDDPLLGPIADPPGLQLLDSTDGTCEWIRYHLHVSRAEGNFFIHDSGWTPPPVPPQPAFQARGAMRTTTRSWPQGARILPVQTRIPVSDRFESGDVATVVVEQIEPGAPEPRRDPVQIVVRHAARDGYPTARAQSGPAYDTKNEWFALAHAIPNALPDPSGASQTVLIGRGWGGDDLSPVGNSPSRRGAMPRRPLLAPAGVGGVVRTFLGSADPRSTASQDVLIDDLGAGVLSGLTDANLEAQSDEVRGCEITAFTSTSGTLLDGIDATASALPVDVTASVNVFTRIISNQAYGLCRIDGEVFAYRWISNTQVRLIGRALLGSTAQEHRLQLDSVDVPALVPTAADAEPTRPVRPTLPVVRLPLGPVGELCTTLPANAQGTALDVVELPFTNYYRDPPASGFSNSYEETYASTGSQRLHLAPFVLVNDPSGATEPEVLRFLSYPTQANQRTTARWLRGLYGTTARTWTPGFSTPVTNRLTTWQNQDPPPDGPGPYPVNLTDPQPAGALNPIVIAWWPRFAPGLPATLPAADTAAALRSRSFAWAGFPLRLAGARFDPAIPALTAANGGIADLPVPQTTGNDLLAMALAAGDGAAQLFDWDQAYANVHTLTTTGTALTRPFNWSRFTLREVDGAEMRVHWRPQSSGLTGIHAAADAAGRAPRLGATDDEAKAAPTATAGVRLRCMAPTRVLAVEEVR